MTTQPKHRFHGRVYVLGDNIDTDQIIPAKHLTLVPTIEEEYDKLGSFALSGLPHTHERRYVARGEMKTEYPVIVAGRNFGCGSSREHAPIALGAAGCRAVIALSFARIFFRNCIATGELYPVEWSAGEHRLSTGDTVTVDLDRNELVREDGYTVPLKPLGDVLPVIDAGGIFHHARKSGLLK